MDIFLTYGKHFNFSQDSFRFFLGNPTRFHRKFPKECLPEFLQRLLHDFFQCMWQEFHKKFKHRFLQIFFFVYFFRYSSEMSSNCTLRDLCWYSCRVSFRNISTDSCRNGLGIILRMSRDSQEIL